MTLDLINGQQNLFELEQIEIQFEDPNRLPWAILMSDSSLSNINNKNIDRKDIFSVIYIFSTQIYL